MLGVAERDGYLSECRAHAVRHIESLLSERDRAHPAYRAVLEYPLRDAKGLRPALAIAACRGLGGSLSDVLPTAAVFELLHNAFLVHDDVEDGSELRRHAPTLAAQLGAPLAIHTGDTMLAMALDPLLANMRLLDLGRALRLLDLVARIMRRTVEGQALELTWIADGRWDITPADYLEMVTLKTAWYTFAGPLAAGAMIAEAPEALTDELIAMGLELGIAFQIRDDVLNLASATATIGKESCGDLWEGKRTLILAHWFATAGDVEAGLTRAILAKPRPDPAAHDRELAKVQTALAELPLEPASLAIIRDAFRAQQISACKTAAEIEQLRRLLDPAIAHASATAESHARCAHARWQRLRESLAPTVHRDVIESLIEYAVVRVH